MAIGPAILYARERLEEEVGSMMDGAEHKRALLYVIDSIAYADRMSVCVLECCSSV